MERNLLKVFYFLRYYPQHRFVFCCYRLYTRGDFKNHIKLLCFYLELSQLCPFLPTIPSIWTRNSSFFCCLLTSFSYLNLHQDYFLSEKSPTGCPYQSQFLCNLWSYWYYVNFPIRLVLLLLDLFVYPLQLDGAF